MYTNHLILFYLNVSEKKVNFLSKKGMQRDYQTVSLLMLPLYYVDDDCDFITFAWLQSTCCKHTFIVEKFVQKTT